MTIDDVKRLPGTAGAKYLAGGNYKIPFLVFFSAGYSESALRANTDARLPKVGWLLGAESSPVASDTSVYADTVEIQLADSSKYSAADTAAAGSGVAIYTANYQQITGNFAANPLDRIDICWGGAEDVETVQKDVDGKPILNSAGEMYSQLPMRPIRGAECCITIRQTANPAATIVQYSYSTNSTAMWSNVDAENGLMGKIQARLVQEDGARYWEVTFPMKFRRDSWRLKLVDNGYVILDDDGDQQAATDGLGQTKQVPTLLDGSGQPLTPGDPPVLYPSIANGDPDDGYEINDKQDWGALGLPNPFTF